MTFTVNANELEAASQLALCELWARSMHFLADEAGSTQVIGINTADFPVAWTKGAPINEDWWVTLIQRSTHERIGQFDSTPSWIVRVGALASIRSTTGRTPMISGRACRASCSSSSPRNS